MERVRPPWRSPCRRLRGAQTIRNHSGPGEKSQKLAISDRLRTVSETDEVRTGLDGPGNNDSWHVFASYVMNKHMVIDTKVTRFLRSCPVVGRRHANLISESFLRVQEPRVRTFGDSGVQWGTNTTTQENLCGGGRVRGFGHILEI